MINQELEIKDLKNRLIRIEERVDEILTILESEVTILE